MKHTRRADTIEASDSGPPVFLRQSPIDSFSAAECSRVRPVAAGWPQQRSVTGADLGFRSILIGRAILAPSSIVIDPKRSWCTMAASLSVPRWCFHPSP